jgi:hypothetical protein
MMGPDYTHWHGTYEVAKHFYSKMIPELETLIDRGRASSDVVKKEAAEKLSKRIDELLASDNHRWYLNQMDEAELKERQERQSEFQKRYAK